MRSQEFHQGPIEGMPVEEQVNLILTEVFRLRCQLETLQNRFSCLLREDDKMHCLIWSELNRLANYIDSDEGNDNENGFIRSVQK